MSHNILQVFGLLKYSVTSLFKKIFDRKAGLKCFFAKLASLRRLCSFEEGTPKDLLLLHSEGSGPSKKGLEERLRRRGSEGCVPSSLRRIWSFEEGPRSKRSSMSKTSFGEELLWRKGLLKQCSLKKRPWRSRQAKHFSKRI